MSDNKKINELYRCLAGLERRIVKLEDGVQELDRIVDLQGWYCVYFATSETKSDRIFSRVSSIAQPNCVGCS